MSHLRRGNLAELRMERLLEKNRCGWANGSALEIDYHDNEWGVPKRGRNELFEALTLEGAQSGLSWATILRKREGYRTHFLGFDVEKVARFTEKDVERLVLEPAIVRHRGKIESTVSNAQAILALEEQGTPFSELIWSFVDGDPVVNEWVDLAALPAKTETSKAMSTRLKKLGFRFVGPTTCYAFMQACGLVNDHVTSCFRYSEVGT